MTGRRSPPFRVPKGSYRVKIGTGDDVKMNDVNVAGETVVSADAVVLESR
jgi:hypothetical protein